jgi:hypothetical protein
MSDGIRDSRGHGKPGCLEDYPIIVECNLCGHLHMITATEIKRLGGEQALVEACLRSKLS